MVSIALLAARPRWRSAAGMRSMTCDASDLKSRHFPRSSDLLGEIRRDVYHRITRRKDERFSKGRVIYGLLRHPYIYT